MEKTLEGTGVIPSAICLGIAGVDRASDEAVVRSIMSRIGYKARILVVNDALIALQAGVGDAPGIVIVSGTGSIAYGRNDQGEASRAGGWGYVLGDEGSGYWIGRLALRAVVRHADGRGRVTSLTPRLLAHFGVDARDRADSQDLSRGARPAVDRRRREIRAARARRRRHGRHGHSESRRRRADDGRNGGDGAARARRARLHVRARGRHVSRRALAVRSDAAAAAGARAAEHGDAARSGARARRRPAGAGRAARAARDCRSTGPTSHEAPRVPARPKMPRTPRPPPSPRSWRANPPRCWGCRRDARRSRCTTSSRGCTNRATRISRRRTRSTSTSSSAFHRTTSAATARSCRSTSSRASIFPASHIHFLNGGARDHDAECERFEREIADARRNGSAAARHRRERAHRVQRACARRCTRAATKRGSRSRPAARTRRSSADGSIAFRAKR